MTETVLIIDFGSQVTQLIARRVREQGVYSEIVPFNKRRGRAASASSRRPSILSGRAGQRHRVRHAAGARLGVQGRAAGARHLLWRAGHGGADGRRRGEAATTASSAAPSSRSPATAALFDGVWKKGERDTVWMSHGDRVTQLAAGLQGGGRVEGRSVCGHRRRERASSTPCSSTPRWRTPAREAS